MRRTTAQTAAVPEVPSICRLLSAVGTEYRKNRSDAAPAALTIRRQDGRDSSLMRRRSTPAACAARNERHPDPAGTEGIIAPHVFAAGEMAGSVDFRAVLRHHDACENHFDAK